MHIFKQSRPPVIHIHNSSTSMMRFSSAAQVALSVLFSSAIANVMSLERRATTCNGHLEVSASLPVGTSAFTELKNIPQLCNRGYGNVSFVGAHNSYAVGVDNREYLNSKRSAKNLTKPFGQLQQTRTMMVWELSPDPKDHLSD